MPVDPVAVAQAQVVPVVLGWLRTHPLILDEFGEGHVSGVNKAPYPHIRVTHTSGGNPPDLVYFDEPELLIEVYSAVDGTPGEAALKYLATLALAVVVSLPEAMPVDPARPVAISRITPTSGLLHGSDARVPDGAGQQRWYMTVRVKAHAVYDRVTA